jgi:hypothetical protein
VLTALAAAGAVVVALVGLHRRRTRGPLGG